MRMYWDRIEVATRVDATLATRVPAMTADLGGRGFSEVTRPEAPLPSTTRA